MIQYDKQSVWLIVLLHINYKVMVIFFPRIAVTSSLAVWPWGSSARKLYNMLVCDCDRPALDYWVPFLFGLTGLEITQSYQGIFQPIPGLINCVVITRKWGLPSHPQKRSRAGLHTSGIASLMQCVWCSCPPDFPKPLLPVINHNCHMLNTHKAVNIYIYRQWTRDG